MNASVGARRAPRRAHRIDTAGAGILLALAAWAALSVVVNGGSPHLLYGAFLLFAVVYAAVRVVTLAHPWVAPAAFTLAAGWLAISQWDILFDGPLRSPLGYSNATGSFYLLAAFAALLVAVRARNVAIRVAAGAATVASALVPWLNGTDTAAALTLLLPLALLGQRGPRTIRRLIGFGAVLVGAALLATVAIGWAYEPDRDGALDGLLERTLSERRAELWHDALAIIGMRPIFGVGPGRFAVESPTALADQDAVWVHQEFLQVGAETGLPGLALLLALVGWGFVRVRRHAVDSGAAVAALGLAAVGVHASVDYVWHFPAIVAATAVLAGTGSVAQPPTDHSRGRGSGPRRPTRSRPHLVGRTLRGPGR